MELTILRRLAATTAVVATAATLAAVPTLAGGGAAAASTTRADSSLSIRAVKPAVRPGASSTIKGRLATPGAEPSGRPVLLEARSQGDEGFIPVGATTSGTSGALRLSVTPETTTLYRWRYAGAADADRAVSGVARVRVRVPQHPAQRIGTTLSIRLKGLDRPSQVVRGKLFGRGAPLGDRWVVLVSRTAGSTEWGFESAARTDGRGRVLFGVRPEVQTAYRLAFLGTPRLRPARSARVVVRMPSDVSISAIPASIDPGQTSTVSGVVTTAGAAVPDAKVVLLARTVRPGATWHAAQDGTTAADGTVSFTVAPERTTAYRLRVVHTEGVRPGTSAAARVAVRRQSSLSVRGRSVPTGYSVVGQLRGGGSTLAGRTVTLQSMAQGTTDWTAVASGTTNQRGRVFLVQPKVAGTQYRLVFDGDQRFLPTVSGTVVVS